MLNVEQNLILNSKFQKSDHFVCRAIAGETILVPLRNNTGELDSIFTLNETGALVWTLLDGQHSFQVILEKILERYEIGSEEAGQDLLELISQLANIGAVEQVR